jgi:site-specific DNA-methyltransferase (adenine-specific)
VFGSMRFFQDMGPSFKAAGLCFAQDVVWEKHNGSGFHADRFKRVHEHASQYYLAGSPWKIVYNEVQKTMDATPRAVRRKKRPAHTGHIEASHYVSEDGGPRIMRSVIYMRSMHGRAIHPTEKPAELIEILIRSSCPPGGIIGDMFAGSGAAGEAAMRAGRRYAGCEIDTEMAAKANTRLAEVLL